MNLKKSGLILFAGLLMSGFSYGQDYIKSFPPGVTQALPSNVNKGFLDEDDDNYNEDFVRIRRERYENGGNVNQEIYGATVDTVKNAIKRADEGQGVLVFVDMGSSIFHAVKAVEELRGEVKAEIADAPLVEGIISAVAANFDEMSLSELKEIAEGSRNFKKIKK